MVIDYNNPDCFCPYCDELLDDDGICPNHCEDDLGLDYVSEVFLDDLLYDDDLYNIVPGDDYLLEDEDYDE